MKFFIFILAFFVIGANAYCIKNNTNQKLFFIVDTYLSNSARLLTFKQYIEPKSTKCCDIKDATCNPTKKNDTKINFFVFLDENAIEGCNVFADTSSNISLDSYQIFDNCLWSHK